MFKFVLASLLVATVAAQLPPRVETAVNFLPTVTVAGNKISFTIPDKQGANILCSTLNNTKEPQLNGFLAMIKQFLGPDSASLPTLATTVFFESSCVDRVVTITINGLTNDQVAKFVQALEGVIAAFASAPASGLSGQVLNAV